MNEEKSPTLFQQARLSAYSVLRDTTKLTFSMPLGASDTFRTVTGAKKANKLATSHIGRCFGGNSRFR